MNYGIENILDVIEQDGEDEVKADLSNFMCDANKDIQDFIQFKAIDFAKKRISISYLVYNEDTGKILGFFTLAHKVLNVPAEGMSNNVKRRMDRYARLNKEKNSYLVSAFLLAQLGKNYALEKEERISGEDLMDCVDSVLDEVQYRIGGGVVYLDSVDNKHLVHFYEEVSGYRKIAERISDTNETKYLQYLKLI